MKLSKAQFSVALICAILGLMLAYQFKNAKNLTSIANTAQIEKLQNQLEEAQKQKETLEKQINDLDQKVEEYEKSAATGSSMVEALKSELDKVRMFAGLTQVQGPGVILTIDPQKDNLNSMGESPVVNAQALQIVVNELNSSGAEAIMINNQRIVNTTEIRQVGNNISINDVKFSSQAKFEIKAIGDKHMLETGLNLRDGAVEWLKDAYGLILEITPSDKVVILKSQKVVKFNYLQPVKEGE